MALGYCGSWLYIQRDFSLTGLAVYINLAVPDSCDHFAACALYRCPAVIQFVFQRLLLCSFILLYDIDLRNTVPMIFSSSALLFPSAFFKNLFGAMCPVPSWTYPAYSTLVPT